MSDHDHEHRFLHIEGRERKIRMTQPNNRDEQRAALLAKIHRLQQAGQCADKQIAELVMLMTGEQNRMLRQLSNKRFGKRRARALKKKGGEFAFLGRGKA